MKKQCFPKINFQRHEQLLSPFARKVYHNMVKHWKERELAKSAFQEPRPKQNRKKVVPNSEGESKDGQTNSVGHSPHEPFVKQQTDYTNEIDWDDMFDPEIFDPTNDADQTELTTSNKDVTNITDKHCGGNLHNVTKTKISKIQKNINDMTNNKIKKSKDNFNNNLRKQNYKTMVKNWLKDMKADASDKQIINKTANKDTSVKTIQWKPKKVVQTKLANKDGLMKFEKPKNLTDDQPEQLNDSVQENVDTKPVALIISQIPVKQIVYEIFIVDENNAHKVTNMMINVTDRELFCALIYSNGFSQLNCHHTNNICEPDGLMFSIDDKFYYFKGCQDELLNTMVHFIGKNKLICYDGKEILIYLMSKVKIDFKLNIFDIKIGGSLLEPDDPPNNFRELLKLINLIPEYTIATECDLQKCAWYMTLMKESEVKLRALLLESSLWTVFVNIEMQLLPVLAAMEHRGVKVDKEKLKSMENVLLSKIKITEQECYEAAGRTFQLKSPRQVSAILYDELQLDKKTNVTIKETLCKGTKSTSEATLRSLECAHPLPKLILGYRQLHKAFSTFLSGVARHVHNGLVKPNWEQTAAATGRIASNNPNLQAIPKVSFNLCEFPENNIEGGGPLNFRSVYIPREGNMFLAADFKQIECRVFAYQAGDAELLRLLTESNDLFIALAAKWLKIPEAGVTREDRNRTKRIIYASLYGAGPRKLMDISDIGYQEARGVIDSFNRTFPCLKSFGRSVVYRCKQNDGRLSTLCGRVRRFNNISSLDLSLKAQAERQAINFIVQGSAADLCKVAMLATSGQLKSSCMEAHLVLQLHDELVWEVHHKHLDAAAEIIKNAMEDCGRACGMNMTLPVSISIGTHWGDMTEHKLQTN